MTLAGATCDKTDSGSAPGAFTSAPLPDKDIGYRGCGQNRTRGNTVPGGAKENLAINMHLI